MPKTLSDREALQHFLGFDPDQAIVVSVAARAPWHVPPTVDPRTRSFDGVDGECLVEDDLQGWVRRKSSAPAEKARLGDFEIVRPPIVVPKGFKIRKALGWEALRALRQFLREAFPVGSAEVVSARSIEAALLDERDELARAIERHFIAQPPTWRAILRARREWRAGAASAPALLSATLVAIRDQWRVEDLAERRAAYDEQSAQELEGAVELPPALMEILKHVRRTRAVGRPITTAAVVRAARAYNLKPRDGALLVALERGTTASFPAPYDRYFAPGSSPGDATLAWSRIWYRR